MKTIACSLTLRWALAPAIGHKHTHPQSEARTRPGPGTVMRADSWHTFLLPSTRSQKAPSQQSPWHCSPAGPQPSAKETFLPLPRSSLTGILLCSPRAPTRSSLLPFLLSDSSLNSWHSAALRQLTAARVGKQSKMTRAPTPGSLGGGREEAASSVACPAEGESGHRRGGELPARWPAGGPAALALPVPGDRRRGAGGLP